MTTPRARGFAAVAVFVGLALAQVGCEAGDPTTSDADPSVDSAQGAWGHLTLAPEDPHFLVNKRPGQTWRVCVPRYMTTMLPGLEAEVSAAVGIWGHYLDRNVEVRIETRDLPRARAGQSSIDLARVYHASCGEGFDAVLGLADLPGATMGVTSGEGLKDPAGHWVSFRRYLFLRDFTLTPDQVDGTPSSWVSFAAATGRAVDRDALLGVMKARSFRRYVERGRRLSLPVLTHEIGHVWGLCDQYEGAGNCDPQNSSSHLASESIMGASTMRERGFLTDDDVAGIRALAKRPGFDAGWSTPPVTLPAPEVKPDLELFRLDRIARQNGSLALVMGVVAHRSIRLEVAYRAVGAAAWTAFLPQDYEGPVDAPRLSLALPIDPASAGRLEFRVSLALRGSADGPWAPPQTLTLAE